MDQLWIVARMPDFACLDVWSWSKGLSSALVGMVMSSSKLFLFSNKAHLNAGARLLLELYCVLDIKHVAFNTCVKLLVTMAFMFTFWDVIAALDFNTNIGRLTDLAKKKAQIGRFAYAYSALSLRTKTSVVWFKKMPKASRWVKVATGAKMAKVGGTRTKFCTHALFKGTYQ